MPIASTQLGKHPLLALKCSASGASVEVFPTKGATIHQIVLPGRNGDLKPVLQPMRTEVEVERQRWAKGAHLAPWPNRIQDAVYTFRGKEYRPFMNFRSQGGHAMHGTVMNEAFRLDRKASDNENLVLVLDGKGWQGYPWAIRMTLRISFKDGGFRMETEIENRAKTDAPAGLGWHPYFTLGKDVRECCLVLPPGKRLGMTERAVPDGTMAPWKRFRRPERIGADFLNDCVRIESASPIASTKLTDPATGEGIEIWQVQGEAKYGYVQVFTAPRRHCLAIEPMTCAPDAFRNGFGLVALKPGESMRNICGVRRI